MKRFYCTLIIAAFIIIGASCSSSDTPSSNRAARLKADDQLLMRLMEEQNKRADKIFEEKEKEMEEERRAYDEEAKSRREARIRSIRENNERLEEERLASSQAMEKRHAELKAKLCSKAQKKLDALRRSGWREYNNSQRNTSYIPEEPVLDEHGRPQKVYINEQKKENAQNDYEIAIRRQEEMVKKYCGH